MFYDIEKQAVFVKHECLRNGHFFSKTDIDIGQMTLSLVLKKAVYPKEHIYHKHESSITYHSEAIANLKGFFFLRTNKRTSGQAKNSIPAPPPPTPIYRCRGIKKHTVLIQVSP